MAPPPPGASVGAGAEVGVGPGVGVSAGTGVGAGYLLSYNPSLQGYDNYRTHPLLGSGPTVFLPRCCHCGNCCIRPIPAYDPQLSLESRSSCYDTRRRDLSTGYGR
jgi:hypothetical protein